MKLVRFHDGTVLRYGIIEGDSVYALNGDVFGECELGGRLASLSEIRPLAPVQPSKIIALGKNYAAHAAEMKSDLPSAPLIFLKPPTAVIGPGDDIVYPEMSQEVDYEGELAVIIGQRAKRVPVDRATHYILGYTCANDVTARDLQRRDGQWSRAKGFDTFCPLGPWIETALDPGALAIQTRLNGEVCQNGSTSDLIFKVEYLVSFISHVMTLEPGDVILTGTPAGVGPMQPGDEVEVEIEGVGVLKNRLVKST